MNIPPKLTEVVAAWFRQSNKGLSFSPYVRSCFNGMSKLHCLLPFCDNQPRYVVFEQPHQYCPSNSDLSPDILSLLIGRNSVNDRCANSRRGVVSWKKSYSQLVGARICRWFNDLSTFSCGSVKEISHSINLCTKK